MLWTSCENATENCSLFAHLWHSSNSLAHWAAPGGLHTRFHIKKQQRQGDNNRKAIGCRGPRVQCGTLMWRWMLACYLKRCYVVILCLSTHINFALNLKQTFSKTPTRRHTSPTSSSTPYIQHSRRPLNSQLESLWFLKLWNFLFKKICILILVFFKSLTGKYFIGTLKIPCWTK